MVGLARLDWLAGDRALDKDAQVAAGRFPDTVCPSPALPPSETKDISLAAVRALLTDSSKPLPMRYKALFTMRNWSLREGGHSNPELIEALSMALEAPGSALLRHEVAFVLGQLNIPKTGESMLFGCFVVEIRVF